MEILGHGPEEISDNTCLKLFLLLFSLGKHPNFCQTLLQIREKKSIFIIFPPCFFFHMQHTLSKIFLSVRKSYDSNNLFELVQRRTFLLNSRGFIT